MFYVVKGFRLSEVGLNIIHYVDDNCSEFTAYETGSFIIPGYYSETELNIIGAKPYDREYWDNLIKSIEYITPTKF